MDELFIKLHASVMIAMAKAQGLVGNKLDNWLTATAFGAEVAWEIAGWKHDGKSDEEIAGMVLGLVRRIASGDVPDNINTFRSN